MTQSSSAAGRTPGWLTFLRYAFIFMVVILALFGFQAVRLYTDWQWFGELKQTGVFTGTVYARMLLFFGLGTFFFLFSYFNLWLAQRYHQDGFTLHLQDNDREQLTLVARKAMRWIALAAAVFFAFMVGGNATTHWSEYLLFVNPASFGQVDPVFHQDIGFYVFRLTFLNYLQGLMLFTVGATLVGTAVIHYSNQALDLLAHGVGLVAIQVRRHLLILLSLFAIIYAWGIWLSRYDLLYSDYGVFFGAGYTDVHARIPALTLETILMLAVAALCLVNIRQGKPFRLPLAGLGLWVVVSILAGGVWPEMMQRFTVVPNQFGREKQYIAHDINFTQRAYGLDRVRIKNFKGNTSVSAADLKDNSATIENIRLWDWPQLGSVYTAKQAKQPYYRFNLPDTATSTGTDFNIDVDRYQLGGRYRQVMVAAREMYQEGLPASAQTWQNQRLQYTHGYGAVMSPVNQVDPAGLPDYFMREMPIQFEHPELKLDKPQIYYGELANDYVFVDTTQSEFDYPSGQGNKETRYEGKGGIPVGGILNRMAWSVRLGDANLVLSSDLSSKSRILFRRNIRERVQKLAPFLNWDNDPYLVVDNGAMVWMMDGYTVTDRYPYSKPTAVGTGMQDVDQVFNYIRNSVKAVVNAYDGSVTLYTADKSDPVLQAWTKIFPGLFVPLDQMPASLVSHIRYPEDMFRFQRDIYTNYHISDPLSYYQKNDAWSVPADPSQQVENDQAAADSARQRMLPYYVIMRLPGEDKEEFMMMTPFTFLSVPNMSAWMAAKCDPEDYGHIIVYRFPKDSSVNGPANIMAQVKALTDVSTFQTLQGQQGSKVIFGNMLVIPVANSLLYAIPVYVQSTTGGVAAVPEIRQVILASGDRVVMRPSLTEAVTALSQTSAAILTPGNQNAAPNPPAGPVTGQGNGVGAASTGPADTLQRALSAYDRARQKEKEYNSTLDELGKALKDLKGKVR